MKWKKFLVLSLVGLAGCGYQQPLPPYVPQGPTIRGLNTIEVWPSSAPATATLSAPKTIIHEPNPAPKTSPLANKPLTKLPLAGAKELEIQLYRSFGSESKVRIRARITEPEGLKDVTSDDSRWTNLWRNLKGLSVEEVQGVQVRFHLQNKSILLISNAEGMIETTTDLLGPVQPGIHEIQAEIEGGQKFWAPAAKAKMIIHSEAPKSLGVISDIDDTVKKSDVSNKLSAAKKLLLGNPYDWESIPGMASLYQSLENRDGKSDGDIFYLSGSPLNLATQMYQFLDLHHFPAGAVALKKWGFEEGDDNPIQQTSYKTDQLKHIFQIYPQKKFLLFGDSAEQDAQIYQAIAKEYPQQVLGIFINNVNQSDPSAPEFQGVHLTQNTAEIAEILFEMGLIQNTDLEKLSSQF